MEVVGWELDEAVLGGTPIAERPGPAAYATFGTGERASVAANAECRHPRRARLLAHRARGAGGGPGVTTADGSALRGPAPAVGHASRLDLAAAYARGSCTAIAFHRARRASRAGLRVGNVAGYGFRLGADGRPLEPNPAEQEVIALVKTPAADGSSRAIASALALRGVKGRTARRSASIAARDDPARSLTGAGRAATRCRWSMEATARAGVFVLRCRRCWLWSLLLVALVARLGA